MIPFQLHRRIPLVRRPFYQRDLARAEAAALRQRQAAQDRGGFRLADGPHPPAPAPLVAFECRSQAEFQRFGEANAALAGYMAAMERALVPKREPCFSLPGYCQVCARFTAFAADFLYATGDLPNWRERLECPSCRLNNRTRAALHHLLGTAPPDAALYLTEQTTPLFAAAKARFPNAQGSEFLRDGTMLGRTNTQAIRHEDATALTFPAAAFDAIASFEVLEHVPAYQRALAEFRRCLRPGGHLVLTVPFVLDRATTLVRASQHPDGTVTHHEPPELHGDPVGQGGVLCFYHFGWDLLDHLRAAGFADPRLELYWSVEYGYLGGWQFLIAASRP
jgi:hypothetical protein